MRTALLALVLGAALSPGAAAAQLVVDVRGGWSLVAGEAVAGGPLDERVDGVLPLEVGLGWRLHPDVVAGVRATYGFARLAPARQDACEAADVDCGASVRRLALFADFAFRDAFDVFVPWAGLGAGWGWTRDDLPLAGREATLTHSGWELLLEGGAGAALGPLELGPFVSAAMGQFVTAGVSAGGDEASDAIGERGWHAYVTLGLRARWGR